MTALCRDFFLQVAKAKQHINPDFAVFSTRKTIRFCMVSPHFSTGFLACNLDSFSHMNRRSIKNSAVATAPSIVFPV